MPTASEIESMYLVALKMLLGDTAKYVGILIGISFAALIMTQQPSTFAGVMARSYSFVTDTSYPDLWIMDPKVRFVDDIKPMQDTKLMRVRGVPGIAWAVPLFKGVLRARLSDGNFQSCIMVGLDDATLIGGPGIMIEGRLEDLRQPDGVIVDDEGAQKYLRQLQPDGTTRPLRVGDVFELNDHRAVVVGIARATRTFFSQPMIFTTYHRTLRFSPVERLRLSFIVAGVKAGSDIKDVKAAVAQRTGLATYTPNEFKNLTVRYFLYNTGMPINFGLSVTLGFLVGAAIAGQMFFNFTQDNLMQFGALKAMGASNATLVNMILLQGIFAGVTGWGIGVGLSSLFGWITRDSVVAFRLVWQILALSAGGVILIVAIAALISIVKVLRLEPAVVFKG